MNSVNASAKIPSLQAQMQWIAGSPQTSSTSTSRLLYDFNNSLNELDRSTGFLPGVIEASTAKQEATICDPQTGKWILFFDGNFIYDGLHNVVNPDNKISSATNTLLTSVIAPSYSENVPTYYIFYIDSTSKHLNYAIVDFPFGLSERARWVGTQSLNIDNGVATPYGLACVNDSEYWVLTLANANTLVAYKCDTTGVNTTPPVHIMLQPFASFTDTVDCLKSSIVTFGNHIAITVNNKIMVGTLQFTSGFSVSDQQLVSTTTNTLAPDFNASGTKLYYLKKWDSSHKNHVWVYELNSGASYSADSSLIFNYEYKTLKLSPGGTIYGINLFSSYPDPLLSITEIQETGSVSISEIIGPNSNSSDTFGNIQYQINNLK